MEPVAHGLEIIVIEFLEYHDIMQYSTVNQQKKKLRDNTEAFVSGRKANNCLLFGDAGTGKSSCIKAIANESPNFPTPYSR